MISPGGVCAAPLPGIPITAGPYFKIYQKDEYYKQIILYYTGDYIYCFHIFYT